jgi:ferredoxin--NADP+ reductase
LNQRGRVLEPASKRPRAGEYVTGWIKRGPTGVIGTNKPDAAETVQSMLEDVAHQCLLEPPEPSAASAAGLVRERQPQHVTWAEWKRLDALEVGRGRAGGRPRVKFTRVKEMLEALGR